MSEPGGLEEAFVIEAKTIVSAMETSMLALEKNPERRELVDDILRSVHTLKGMAATLRRERAAALCHGIEDALQALRDGALEARDAADSLFRAIDALSAAVAAVENRSPEPDHGPMLEELAALAARRPAGAPAPIGAGARPRIRIDTVDVKMRRLDLLMNLAEELMITKLRFDELRPRLRVPEVAAVADAVGRLATEMQYQVTQIRLVPIRLVFERLPRMVRDLSRSQGKSVELRHNGGDLELDRRVAEELGEALIHLVRNAIDHGIETPDKRAAAGKPAQGEIRLIVSKAGSSALIEVSDDGAGLDFPEIARAARTRGLISEDAGEPALVSALLSGLSTRSRVTSVSGRGLGLDIARRKVEGLGGTLAVSSAPGRGAAFKLEIPLTLAVIKVLFVVLSGRKYAIPLSAVSKIVRVDRSQVRGVLDRKAAVIGEWELPLLKFDGIPDAVPPKASRFPVVVLGNGRERVGLAVDELVATQDVLVKPLNRLLRASGLFTGTTIVGTGEPVLVLDAATLFTRAKTEVPA
jgi:two-component system, chemotaxis family, sensor kinase CheA